MNVNGCCKRAEFYQQHPGDPFNYDYGYESAEDLQRKVNNAQTGNVAFILTAIVEV